jgi:hypothetical protein
MEQAGNIVKCTSCGKNFRFTTRLPFTPPPGLAQPFMLYGEPQSIQHCKDGNYVDIFGELVEFSECIEGEWEKTQPFFSHPLQH